MIVLALGACLVLFAAERLWELRLSARHARGLSARGGFERGRGHFPLFVALHTLYPLGLALEVLAGNTRPGPWWPLWLALVAAAQALRLATMRALGEYWNARIWVTPGMPRVRRGPYRWCAHPGYLAVAVELAALALLFGAWRTALAATVVNAVALALRIPAEARALREAGAAAPAPAPQGVSRTRRTKARSGVR
jgi:methyltransferase